MGKLAGRIVEAFERNSSEALDEVGPALRSLRLISGLTQSDMAKRLDVQQSAVSKIENGGDVHLSTIKKYVEALGAALRIDASFPSDTPLAIHIRNTFETQHSGDDQLVLPLLGDDLLHPHRDVVLSIRPQYSEKIIDGSKTVELRRRFPVSAPKGTIAYIYSTSPTRAMVGAAEIANVLKLPVDEIWDRFESKAFIAKDDFDQYFAGTRNGFVLMFEHAKAFSHPIPLSELREQFGFEAPQSFLYPTHDLRKALKYESSIVSH